MTLWHDKQARFLTKIFGGNASPAKSKRRRCRFFGAEWNMVRKRLSPPQPTRKYGKRHGLLSGVRPGRKRILAYFEGTERSFCIYMPMLWVSTVVNVTFWEQGRCLGVIVSHLPQRRTTPGDKNVPDDLCVWLTSSEFIGRTSNQKLIILRDVLYQHRGKAIQDTSLSSVVRTISVLVEWQSTCWLTARRFNTRFLFATACSAVC